MGAPRVRPVLSHFFPTRRASDLKGCGFLWTHPDHKRLIRPTAIGNQFGKSYTAAFDWPGTKDFSAWLAVVAALEFQNRFGAEAIRDYCHGLEIGRAHV